MTSNIEEVRYYGTESLEKKPLQSPKKGREKCRYDDCVRGWK